MTTQPPIRKSGASVYKTLGVFVLLLIVALVIALFAVQHLGGGDPRADMGRHIYLSLKYYAAANDDQLPMTLEALVPRYFIEQGEQNSRRILENWVLLQPGAAFEPDREGQRLLVENPDIPRSEVVTVFADGRVEYRPVDPSLSENATAP